MMKAMTNEEAISYFENAIKIDRRNVDKYEKLCSGTVSGWRKSLQADAIALSALRAQEKDHIANVNETAEPCECIIGLYYDSEDAKLVTLKELKEEIKENKQYNEYMARNYSGLSYVKLPEYSLRDYFDGRKSTNLTRFKYCPMCGRALTKPKGE